MKTYRIITLFAALLITASLAGVISHEKVGDPDAQSPSAAVGVP
jgi:outer membrane murein-binding lipoprotein Lpp